MTSATKSKILNILLILTSLLGFLEWGKGNQLFLIQAEAEIFVKMIENPMSVLHPFTIMPFIGQILLLITLFQRRPNKKLTYIGMACIGILLTLMFAIGCMELNFKILASTIPFLMVGFLTIRHNRLKG